MAYAGVKQPVYQGPTLPGQDVNKFRATGQTVASTGQVLGASTQAKATGGGGGVGAGLSQPTYSNPPLEDAPQQGGIDFDALIAPAIDGLEAAISPLNQGFADTQSSIQAGAGRQTADTNREIGAQVSTLESGKAKSMSSAENAQDQARRQYSEIQQGIQSLYGGSTGTGAFATELAGRQTTQNIGQIREGLSAALQDADNRLIQVRELGRVALVDIEDKAREQINQARNELNSNITQIRMKQGELRSRKSELAMQAMQFYQQQVSEVNARNTAFKQQLYQQQKAAESALMAKRSSAQQVAEQYQLFNAKVDGQMTPVQRGVKTGTIKDISGLPVTGKISQLYSIGTPGTTNSVEDLINQYSQPQQ